MRRESPEQWIEGLDKLRRDYEVGMDYAGRLAHKLVSAIYVESVRVQAMPSEEIAAVESMSGEERIT